MSNSHHILREPGVPVLSNYGFFAQIVSDPPLTMIKDTLLEGVDKPKVGAYLFKNVASLINVLVSKPDFSKVKKICKRYSCPTNVESLVMRETPSDVNKMMDNKTARDDQ